MEKQRKTINVFTHIDLDGAGCAVLAHLLAKHSGASITVKYCNYETINQEVNRLLDVIDIAHTVDKALEIQRQILISDISVDEATAARLHAAMKTDVNLHVALVDHHPPKDHLLQYDWAYIKTDKDVSGTFLLFGLLPDELKDRKSLGKFMYDVTLYDTWLFKERNNANSEHLNMLLGIIGLENFVSCVVDWFSAEDPWGERPFIVMESPWEDVVINENNRRKEYCALHGKKVTKLLWNEHTIGVVFAEQYISQLADHVLSNNEDIDICAVVNMPSSVSLRT